MKPPQPLKRTKRLAASAPPADPQTDRPAYNRTLFRRADSTQAWVDRSRQKAAAQPGRAPGSTLAARGAVSRRDAREDPPARLAVMDRDMGRCRYPHDHPLMAGCACSAPYGMTKVDGRWQQNPANPGRIELCHVIARLLSGPLRWDPHNLFAGCDAGNAWQEDNTGAALTVGVQAHPWERVLNGRRIPT